MRTTLRFASVVAGLAGLILLAVVIQSGNDWFSTLPGVKQPTAVHTAAPEAAAPIVPAVATPPPAQPATAAPPQATPPPPQPGAVSGPKMAPAAAVSTPRPAVAVQAVVGQAAAGRAALSLANVAEAHGDRPNRDGQGNREHDGGGDRHARGRGGHHEP